MGKEIEILKGAICQAFPNLKTDADFKISSPETPNYNCIAWAYSYEDRIMWPGGTECKKFDGFHFWPDDIEDSEEVLAFIKVFQLKGYEICDSWQHEESFQKIALYVKRGTTECTHAARELRAGKWTSKLGDGNDIQHGTPFGLESDIYGVVYCFMKRLFS